MSDRAGAETEDYPLEPTEGEAGSKLTPGLYVIATPIGNLGDMTQRGKSVIANLDLLLCEDTRTTGRLLYQLGLKAPPLLPYHDHNGERVRPGIIARLLADQRIGLVSDAGTPAIADPGFKLVREATRVGIAVRAIPGASSVTSALSISGLPTDRFFFQGFLPSKKVGRLKALEGLKQIPGTLVFLESPRRLKATLEDAFVVLGDREAVFAREITKYFEEVRRGRLGSIHAELGELKGEIVLMIGPADEDSTMMTAIEVDEALLEAVRSEPPREAARQVAEISGWRKNVLYQRLLELRSDGNKDH